MTELLKKAFERASKLPEDQQDALAAVVFDELESEQRWTELLANSQDKLAKLADEALEEAKQGKTRPFSEL
jgi:hypothetical protein